MRISRTVIAAICVAVAASGVLVAVGYAGFFNNSTFTGTTVHFTIVEASTGPLKGMNGSAYYPTTTPWPLLEVNQGVRVIIHVMNNSTSEPHGFAINHYFPSGVSVSAQQSYNVVFIANEVGNFTIYCNIVCSIHPFMQNGRLVVK
jgi:FtsP/CotA-like multicopper oxidase with cupredoxin domain